MRIRCPRAFRLPGRGLPRALLALWQELRPLRLAAGPGEGRGTCSTKHALLADLARENRRHVALVLGIYEMDEDNTQEIGTVLDRNGLPCVPEAHCYLVHEARAWT